MIDHAADCRCRPCRIARGRAAAGLDRAAPASSADAGIFVQADRDAAVEAYRPVWRASPSLVPELRLVVVGVPAPQGSMRSYVVYRKSDRHPVAVTTSDNPSVKGWRQTIADVAARELARPEFAGLFFEGGVALDVLFVLPRPQALCTRGKILRAFPHLCKPDVDKLTRAAADALTGVLWRDDAQITDLRARKRYAGVDEHPRAEIWIRVADLEATPGGLQYGETRQETHDDETPSEITGSPRP